MFAARALPRTVPRVARLARAYATEAPASEKLRLSFALPHQSVFANQEIVQVNIPAQTGEMGVLANHVPAVEALKPGLVEIQTGSETKKYFVSSGFASIHPNNSITINAVEGYELEAFDAAAVRANLADAQKAVAGAGSEEEKAEAAIELEVYEALSAALKA